MRSLAVALALLLAGSAVADPCDAPWSLDYRHQPGPWEFAVGGSTLDMELFEAAGTVVLLGKDGLGPWLRTYQFRAPATVRLIDERRDLDEPTALIVVGARAWVLDASRLREFALGGAGMLFESGSAELDGAASRLAYDGAMLWAGGGTLVSEIDVSEPSSPRIARTASTPVVAEKPRLRAHDGEAWLIGPGNRVVHVDGRDTEIEVYDLGPATWDGQLVDVGWLADGSWVLAWRVFDGIMGNAGHVQVCPEGEWTLRFSASLQFLWSCGDLPWSSSEPVPVEVTPDAGGVLVSRAGRGTLGLNDPAWSGHTGATTEWGALLRENHELFRVGETLIGRTRDGLEIHPPDAPAPDPVLARVRLDDTTAVGALASDGTTLAVGVGDEIRLVDTSDVSAPVPGGLIPAARPYRMRFVDGDPHLFVIRGAEVTEWDADDPHNPVEVGTLSLPAGSVDVAPFEGRTAVYSCAEGSSQLEVFATGGDSGELLGTFQLTTAFAFFQVAGPIVGGDGSFVDLRWNEPLEPRDLWTVPLGASTVSPGAGTGAAFYTPEVVVTRQLHEVWSVALDRCPAQEADHSYHRRIDGDVISRALGDDVLLLWHYRGMVVAEVGGPRAGTVLAYLQADWPAHFSEGLRPLAVSDRYLAVGGDHEIMLLAPHCDEPDQSVPVVVRAIDAVPDGDGCARVRFETSGSVPLDLQRVVGGVRTILQATEGSPGVYEARDCPEVAAEYQVVDAVGTVHARVAFVPGTGARARLLGAHPNPFNPRTEIRYATVRPGPVRLSVHDSRGRLVKVLRDEVVPAGPGVEVWDGADASGTAVAAGVYFVRMRTGDQLDVMKVALVK